MSQRLAARERVYNVQFVAGNAERIPLPDNYADKVTSGYGFHWFYKRTNDGLDDRREAVAREMYRILKPGGKVGIAAAGTGSFRNIIDAIDMLRKNKWLSKYYREEETGKYLLGFVPQTEESLEKILLKVGFVHVRFGEKMIEKAEDSDLHPDLDAYLRKTRAIAKVKDFFERIIGEDRHLATKIIEKELSGKELIEEEVVFAFGEVPKNKKIGEFKYSS